MVKTPNCLICKSPGLTLFVNGLLDKGLSNRGISSAIEEVGGKLDPDVIGRHKNNGHWQKKLDPDRPKPTQRDLALMMRDKVADAVEDMDGEALLLFGKEFAPMVGKGLQAQAMLDKREAAKTKLSGAAEIVGMLSALLHGAAAPQLGDGTIEGEYKDVTPDAAD